MDVSRGTYELYESIIPPELPVELELDAKGRARLRVRSGGADALVAVREAQGRAARMIPLGAASGAQS